LAVLHFFDFQTIGFNKTEVIIATFLVIETTFLWLDYIIDTRKKSLLNQLNLDNKDDSLFAKIPFLNIGALENVDTGLSYFRTILSVVSDVLVFFFINIALAIIIMKIN
jgi:hypothetical protein